MIDLPCSGLAGLDDAGFPRPSARASRGSRGPSGPSAGGCGAVLLTPADFGELIAVSVLPSAIAPRGVALAVAHIADAVFESRPAPVAAVSPLVAPPREPTLFDLRLVGHPLPPEGAVGSSAGRERPACTPGAGGHGDRIATRARDSAIRPQRGRDASIDMVGTP